MGTIIEMVTTVPLPGIKTVRGALWLSKKAAKICMKESGTDPGELDLVIYAGMYRNKHIGEPSIASLIQKGISANPSVLPPDNRTFSFDVNTGGCGVLNAIQIMDGFITSGRISKGMIITADSEPFKGQSEAYNFRPSASAIILNKAEKSTGFSLIKNYSFPEYIDSFRSYISWKKRKDKTKRRNILVIEQSDNYLEECLSCSLHSLQDFYKESFLQISDIDMIITSQSPHGFPAALSKALKDKVKVVVANGNRGELHTSGPSFALKKVWGTEEYSRARKILFLTVSAGINTMLALYEK